MKMKMKTMNILVLLSTMSAIPALADDIYLGTPSYGGNGCPAGSASVSLSPDAKALSILFDSYMAEAGGSTGKTLDRKACSVAIPVHVPQGYSLSVFQVDYRGFVAVPLGGMAQFNVEYFFAGAQGPRYTKTFNGPASDGYTLNNTLMASAVVWSACGQDVILRTNSNMLARTNSRREQTIGTIDSADISSGIIYNFQWKRCN